MKEYIPEHTLHPIRRESMMNEIKAYIDSGYDYAVLWTDDSVGIGYNVQLYRSVLRKMKLTNDYKISQRKHNVVISKKDAYI